MALILTVTARVRDWQALRALHREGLVEQARLARASRLRSFRDIHDASRLLVLLELPDADALREASRALLALLGPLVGHSANEWK